jgi:hypothetical protein
MFFYKGDMKKLLETIQWNKLNLSSGKTYSRTNSWKPGTKGNIIELPYPGNTFLCGQGSL